MPQGHTESPLENKDIDWDHLRSLSLRPGGFREERTAIWAKLLSIGNETGNPHGSSTDKEDTASHPDERQIKLDTDRSFVLYPVDESASIEEREALQEELRELIVNIFRRRPKLSYFQGYHDIITVLFLTLPPELRLACAENISLQRLRDAMGAGLEPIMGLLRVLKHLFELADPPFAAVLQEASPLPYFALSNLLTLFSHDMPTLELIQHVFDYILCRPPIITVYLAATLALTRKAEVERLHEAGEEGMIHSVLSGLPGITDDNSQPTETNAGEQALPPNDDEVEVELPDSTHSSSPTSETLSVEQEDVKSLSSDIHPPESEDSTMIATPKAEEEEKGERIYSRPTTPLPRKPTIPLTDLLTQTDELFAQYPPTHRSIQLASIMGPQSVVYTWSEDPSNLPDPDEAEAMVEHPELVIRPFPEPEEGGGGEKPPRRGRRHKDWRLISQGSNAMLASTVIALSLSIIIAYYGQKESGKELSKASRWAARMFFGLGERWWSTFDRV